MAIGLFHRWRNAKAKAAAERAELQRHLDAFLAETEPSVPKSRYPNAALYRHAWRRAVALQMIYQERSDLVRVAHYEQLEKLAAEEYFKVAPASLAGKPKVLRMGNAGMRIFEIEFQRLFPTLAKQRERPLACIYIGTCEQGRVYVGQTVGAPEVRWVQHRFGGTGPFKNGDQYITWKVIEGSIEPAKLNERESYYIGLYDAHKSGYNETVGNDWRAYQRGVADRNKSKF